MTYYNHLPNITLGYHGCDRAIAEEILSGKKNLEASDNDYDWLGPGIYFWELNPKRALSFATEKKARKELDNPCVIGAALTLGNCIDTLSENSIRGIQAAYVKAVEAYGKATRPLPENTGGRDRVFKRLDCAVIQSLHQMLADEGEPKADSLRGLYHEGAPIYDTSSFYEKSHIQICMTNPACIKGVFRIDC